MFRKILVALGAVALMGLATASPASGEALVEEEVSLPVNIHGRTYRLEALIVRPAHVTGRLPIVLIAHGRPVAAEYRNVRAGLNRNLARNFAYRGWLAASIVRRGFGRSEGVPDGGVPSSCQNQNFYSAAITANAEDYAAALQVLAKRPDADASRVIAIGASSGGATVIGLAGLSPRGLVGVISLAGNEGRSVCGVYEPDLLGAIAAFGRTSRIPALWLQAENDSFVHSGKIWNIGPLAWARRMYDTFIGAGGKGEFVTFGTIGKEGHYLTSTQGLEASLPVIDRFLRSLDLPTWDPALMETAIRHGNVAKTLRPQIARYLAQPAEKAFAISASGRYSWWVASTSYDTATARQKAVEGCEKQGEPCGILLENFDLLDDVRTVSRPEAPRS